MSSDQYSEMPLPPDKKRCPYCGDIVPKDANVCSVCQEDFAVRAGLPKAKVEPEHLPTFMSGKYAAMMFAGVLVIIATALATRSPGVLVLLLLGVPALIHAVIATAPGTKPNRVHVILGTFGVGVAIFLAGMATFVVTCFTIGLSCVALTNSFGLWGLVVAVICGIVAALWVAGWLTDHNFPTKDDER